MESLRVPLQPLVPIFAVPVYGIPQPVRSRDPLWLQLHEYVAIARDCWSAQGWRGRFASLTREPVSDT